MKILAAAGLAVLMASTAPPDSPDRSSSPLAVQEAGCDTRAAPGIEALLADWREAIATGSVEELAGLVTEDAEFWSPGQPTLRGREALRAAFEPVFARYGMDQEFRCRELIVAGEWAFLRGLEVNRLTARETGEETVVRQRAFSLVRRGPDGAWRFHRGMTNPPPEDRAGR
jgi:uncharacterized protein (TIGR02246 family)